jgi:hypothetical protein
MSKRLKAGCELGIEFPPVPCVFFRPEEVHTGSTPGTGFRRTTHYRPGIADDGIRRRTENFAVPHLYGYWLPTIQARAIDAYRLTGKQPADRQRFEPSLGEPFLLAPNGDAVLIRENVERRE